MNSSTTTGVRAVSAVPEEAFACERTRTSADTRVNVMRTMPSGSRFMSVISLPPSYLILLPGKSYWLVMSREAFSRSNRYDSLQRLSKAKPARLSHFS